MKNYHDLLAELLSRGHRKADRTNTGTLSLFGPQLRFNLQEGFPLLTTKRVHWKSVVHELLWFIRGETNIRYLKENGVSIWDEWADENGDLGPVYGKQWRDWGGIDQLQDVVNRIRFSPDSRRLIVSAWNVGEIEQMALPPCHTLFQFYCVEDRVSLQLYQRSADVFLGLPFNIASYALLLEMVARVTGKMAEELIITIGDAHLYLNHVEQAKELLSREPKELPWVRLAPKREVWQYRFEDVDLVGYNPHPSIKAPVAV